MRCYSLAEPASEDGVSRDFGSRAEMTGSKAEPITCVMVIEAALEN
jgi:hypothetical protein